MSVGKTPTTRDLFRSTVELCKDLPKTSIYALLYREGGQLFADASFADLFLTTGRDSVPPRVVATVMVLQRLEGLSDRDAVERFAYDVRWKYAAGGLAFDYPSFVHTVLVDMRARLRRSERPNRIFEAVLAVAQTAGLVGKKRVLDSTALYDAVATQDTVTLVRSAIRGVLRSVTAEAARGLRTCLRRDDDYVTPGKPHCDWDDPAARDALIDSLARDGFALLSALEDQPLHADASQAVQLLATVLGQDIEPDPTGGGFRIRRGVAQGRVISTVDPEARHGHKTQARSFDGYKAHVAIDPESELITCTAVGPANGGDAELAPALLPELAQADAIDSVFGDASYGTAEFIERLDTHSANVYTKVQQPPSRDGMYPKTVFRVDLTAKAVTCPAQNTVPITPAADGSGAAKFGRHCMDCTRRALCTSAKAGREIYIHAHEATLQRERLRQRDPEWRRYYRAIRPKIERKFAHLMRHRHGGRRARVRGRERVAADFALLAAATNLKRIAVLRAA